LESKKKSKSVSLTPQHPGKIVAYLMVKSLASQLQITVDDTTDLLQGKVSVTPELSTALAKAFKTDNNYWIRLQKLYDGYGNDDEEETIIV